MHAFSFSLTIFPFQWSTSRKMRPMIHDWLCLLLPLATLTMMTFSVDTSIRGRFPIARRNAFIAYATQPKENGTGVSHPSESWASAYWTTSPPSNNRIESTSWGDSHYDRTCEVAWRDIGSWVPSSLYVCQRTLTVSIQSFGKSKERVAVRLNTTNSFDCTEEMTR